ncbi:hypothetical protein MMC25_004667 [Agyrium rufum]|nr:hypothetical protein [Agyrium rufum]
MADLRSASSGPSRPMNVEQVVKRAQEFDYNPLIPLKYWLRSAKTILKEAGIYEREGNDQQTYLLLFRHAQLVLGCLSNHADLKQDDNQKQLLRAEKEVMQNLAKMEILKPRINKRYDRFEQMVADRDTRRASEASEKQRAPSMGDSAMYRQMASDPATAGSQTVAAEDNKELAVQLAQTEAKRRATVRRKLRQAGTPGEAAQYESVASERNGLQGAKARDDDPDDDEALSRQMQNVRLQMDGKRPQNGSSRVSRSDRDSAYKYPTIQKHAPISSYNFPSYEPGLGSPPRPPPKERNLSQTSIAPLRPLKSPLDSFRTTAPPPPPPPPPPPVSVTPPPPDKRASSFTFQPSAYLENGNPLRTIFLPPNLRPAFLQLAQANTRANLETCGVLCGTLISNALFISKLVIPEQESTSDTCETVNESAMFDYVDGEDLMVLGWIHTHPTQTCFMSSRDLHTHCGYQVMMPESIAIVCAPSKGDSGIFRLTDPPGMKAILGCRQTGLFHPHGEDRLYTDAERPRGHVFEAKGLEFDVVDMRPKK